MSRVPIVLASIATTKALIFFNAIAKFSVSGTYSAIHKDTGSWVTRRLPYRMGSRGGFSFKVSGIFQNRNRETAVNNEAGGFANYVVNW